MHAATSIDVNQLKSATSNVFTTFKRNNAIATGDRLTDSDGFISWLGVPL